MTTKHVQTDRSVRTESERFSKNPSFPKHNTFSWSFKYLQKCLFKWPHSQNIYECDNINNDLSNNIELELFSPMLSEI